MMAKGYKVVRVMDGVKVSCVMSMMWKGKQGTVKYEADVWVHPVKGNGPLTVFDNVGAANHFVCNEVFDNIPVSELEVWVCEYEKCKETSITEIWYQPDDQTFPRHRSRCTLPSGTVLVDRVKLIERM